MIELPEAITLSKQLNDTINGKIISNVIAAHTKQKLTWYYGNPEKYQNLLQNKKIDNTVAFGGFVEISAQNMKILFRDGVNLRFFEDRSAIPDKHQLLLKFVDKSMLIAFVQMYGGVGCFIQNKLDNTYYTIAKEKPSPLSKEFDEDYFTTLISDEHVQNLSLKAFLATEQRIPGLGNGVLQDILFNAKLHPKQKIKNISEKQTQELFKSIKTTLTEMVNNNGRNTERDLFGNYGEYRTKMCKNTVGKRCDVCGSTIIKSNYTGGSIYFCPGCQTI
ncbi:Formamidopyrimidine-DNA glycosylase [uncultured archaeon]|nr:Formamidopyrimidine-DNA glycosylase [uncultured archaeon]